ncbi:MAG TPA: MFS transporter, partial [Gaiellaceae bacterium]|nr:MFS transporter [Gaiellaceae bacterium]
LAPLLAGLTANALAIAANGGEMPVSRSALAAAGLGSVGGSNISAQAGRLRFLGDVFAVPHELPLANVFSVGDILIALGMIGFVVAVATDSGAEPPFSPRRMLAPLRLPAYRRLAAGKLVSQTGDWLTIATIVGWVYVRSGSTGAVAAVLALRMIPPILGGGIAGVVVDRLPKTKLLVWIELGRGAAVATALAAVLTDQLPLVFAALALSGVLATITAAAVPALVPSLLPSEQLSAANAGLGLAGNVAMAIGALCAGLILTSVGAAPALAIDVVTFGVAALCYCRLPAVPTLGQDDARAGALAGLRHLLVRRRLVVLLAAFATATLATGLVNATLPRFLDGVGGLDARSYGFGFAAIAAGLASGQAFIGLTRFGGCAVRWIGAGLVAMASLLIMLSLSTQSATVILVLFGIGFVDGTTDVLFETVVQQEADPQYLGSIFGFAAAFVTATMLIAVALAPLANEILPAQRVVLASGIFLVLAGVIALYGPGDASTRARRAPVGSRA